MLGSIAQLVQSVCLTSRGSGVRLPLLPLKKRSDFPVALFVMMKVEAPGPLLGGSSVLHLFPFKVNGGTAAGINALRRLKIKRCGELALRLSSRLTFANVYFGRSCNSSRQASIIWSHCGLCALSG